MYGSVSKTLTLKVLAIFAGSTSKSLKRRQGSSLHTIWHVPVNQIDM